MAREYQPLVDERQGIPRVSAAVAGAICGDHNLTSLSHTEKVQFLVALWHAYQGVLRAGWVEHTGDWDWSLYVVLKDGTHVGATFDEPYHNCDTFTVVGLDKENYVPLRAHGPITQVVLEVDPLDEDPVECEVLIDDIVSVYLMEE